MVYSLTLSTGECGLYMDSGCRHRDFKHQVYHVLIMTYVVGSTLYKLLNFSVLLLDCL